MLEILKLEPFSPQRFRGCQKSPWRVCHNCFDMTLKHGGCSRTMYFCLPLETNPIPKTILLVFSLKVRRSQKLAFYRVLGFGVSGLCPTCYRIRLHMHFMMLFSFGSYIARQRKTPELFQSDIASNRSNCQKPPSLF